MFEGRAATSYVVYHTRFMRTANLYDAKSSEGSKPESDGAQCRGGVTGKYPAPVAIVGNRAGSKVRTGGRHRILDRAQWRQCVRETGLLNRRHSTLPFSERMTSLQSRMRMIFRERAYLLARALVLFAPFSEISKVSVNGRKMPRRGGQQRLSFRHKASTIVAQTSPTQPAAQHTLRAWRARSGPQSYSLRATQPMQVRLLSSVRH